MLGKYLAVLVWLLLWLLLTLAMPLTLAHATHLDWGKLAAATLGLALMLAALAAHRRGLLRLCLASGHCRRRRA